ncbi:MAG TPA: TIGR01459 family HAD-type hydrolase [Acetobacteraceae bacterium]|nr:TIGR01459 family HAD-type hydrolase [Acetobacteraceae bacterium]
MEHLSGFSTLAARYDGFVLDLWGVIHDGVNAFPHAVDCLRRLHEEGKRTLLLSNVPRPNGAVQAMMRRMGISDALYTDILTSGEAVRHALQRPPDLWWAELGQRVFHLGPERDRPVLEGLPLELADSPAAADFVLNTGPDDHRNPSDMAEFEPVLQDCARYRLKMVCGNPDLEVIRGGVRVLCAGALAVRYRELGGDVRSLGKPDPAIYQPVLERLGLPPDRVLAVGDSLRTDIAGAAAVDLASCWVLDGIHRAEVMDDAGGFDTAKAQAEADAAGLAPVATLPRFAW